MRAGLAGGAVAMGHITFTATKFWFQCPIRTCRKTRACSVCRKPIEAGAAYYARANAGAHITCVDVGAERREHAKEQGFMRGMLGLSSERGGK